MNSFQKKSRDYLVIIPTYNEEDTIEELVARALKYADVCVVDDCSKDRTPDILEKIKGIHVITHQRNTHIPGALMDGMRYALAQGYPYAIAMDAGFSHNPDEIPRFISHPHSDVAIGTRTVKVDVPLYRKGLSLFGNIIYNISLGFPRSLFKKHYYRDISSGYRRYSAKAMRLLTGKKLESRSFDVLFETVMYAYQNDLAISEVPITYKFTNSSLKTKVVIDCLKMCLKVICRPRK